MNNPNEPNEPIYNEVSGYVNRWLSSLKFLCITTIIFSLFSLLFAGLTVYTSEGGVVETHLDFESRSFLLTPIIMPIIFLYANYILNIKWSDDDARFNRARNRSGRMVNKKGGRIVTREVFAGWKFPTVVTIVLFACYIASFSLFFAYGTPRCATESLNNNQGEIYVLHKGACEVYNLGFIKLLLSFLIVAQTVAIMFYFYNSLNMQARNNVTKRAQNLGSASAKKVRDGAVRVGQGIRGMRNPKKPAPTSLSLKVGSISGQQNF